MRIDFDCSPSRGADPTRSRTTVCTKNCSREQLLVEYYQFPSSTKTTAIPISDMVLFCLLGEMNGPTASLENARDLIVPACFRLQKTQKVMLARETINVFQACVHFLRGEFG